MLPPPPAGRPSGRSRPGRGARIRSVHVVAAGALVLAMGGSATAAAVITGKQIKDNTVTSKDIKNGSLRVKDFKASEATKVRPVRPVRPDAPLPFTTSTPLTGANVWFGTENSASLGAFDTSAVKCPGTAIAPEPTAGTMCVYVKQVTNIKAGSGELFAGASDFADAAESSGFYVLAESGADGPMVMRYVWAYKAP